MTCVKLTSADYLTEKHTLWGPGITHEVSGLLVQCQNGIHAYRSAELAVFLDPIHGIFGPSVVAWECEASGELIDDGLKLCCRRLTTIRRMPIRRPTNEQRIYFAIKCALAVYAEHDFCEWAAGWIGGLDRSRSASLSARLEWGTGWSEALQSARLSAFAAWSARAAAESAAAWSARAAAESAAASAAESARSAAESARSAARAAAWAAWAAAEWSAAWSAWAAAESSALPDLQGFAEAALAWVDPSTARGGDALA